MKVLFVSANTERINMPALPLGLGCVAEAVRQAGHEIMLVDLMGVTDPARVIGSTIGEFRPEVIGVSVRNIDDQKMQGTKLLLDQVKQVVSACRESSAAPIVLGGAGYSMFPVGVLEFLHADMGIQGEGEGAFIALLEKLANNSSLSGVPGLYLREKGLQGDRAYMRNLDDFPLPSHDLWDPSYSQDPDFWMPVQTRRGCAMDCSYCSTATIEGKNLRKRSPSAVVQWIKEYAEKGFHKFYFTDNTFNLPLSYARDLCRQILDGGLVISWRCIIYPTKSARQLVKDMAAAGCREVSLGFESGDERMLRAMNKRFTTEDVRSACELFKEFGIRRMGFLLLGGPGETRESVEKSLAFADSLNLEMLKINVGIRIYPNTPLARIARNEGIIASEDDLLFPKFYIQKNIEEWLRATAEAWLAKRSNWFM